MKKSLIGMALLLSLSVHAEPEVTINKIEMKTDSGLSMNVPLDFNGMIGNLVTAKPRVAVGTRLMINENATARIFKTLEGAVDGNRRLNLTAGNEIEVLEMSADGKVAHIGIDSANSSTSDLMVSVEDLEAKSLSVVEVVPGAEDDEVSTEDEGLFAARRRRGGMTYCYRDVKTTLLKNKICGRYASGVRAAEGYSILARECGMIQVGNVDPDDLPPFSVCVSKGGRPCGKAGACGHIAIKLKSGLWFGAGTRGTPYLPNSSKRGYKPRQIIGCLKPAR